MNETKKIIILLGISSAGKSVLGSYLETLGISRLKTHTTKIPRKNESNDYYYVSEEEFNKIDKLEQTYYTGNYYGLSRKEVEQHNEDLVYCILDYRGAKQIKKNFGENNVTIIYIHINPKQQEERLRSRGDLEDEIKKRIVYSIQNDEVKNNIEIADYIITNNKLETSKQILKYIVKEIRNEENTVS